MFFWLIIIILSYLFFSIAFFGDKLIVSGKANAALYTFYIGVLSLLIAAAIPFIHFSLPPGGSVIWIMADGVAYVFGAYTMFLALETFEVSKVMPTIGALQPIMILALTFFIWGGQLPGGLDFLAFILLLAGSFIISLEGKLAITRRYLLLVTVSALFFSLDYVFSKIIFLHQPFLQGLIWMRLASFAVVLLFLFSKKLRAEIFSRKGILNKKTGVIFLITQTSGGVAGLLQSLAISLVPVSYLAILNSLRGIQYIFLFFITVFFTVFLPQVFKENISKKIIIQKVAAILIIVLGLAILVW